MQISSRPFTARVFATIATCVAVCLLAASTPARAQQNTRSTASILVQFKLPPADIPNISPQDTAVRNVAQNKATLKITLTGKLRKIPTGQSLPDQALPIAASVGSVENAPLTAMQALEKAAANGQPTALWRLGVMYERGDGVDANQDKAFAYFSEIANSNAEASPTSPEARIIARSFLKISNYLHDGYEGNGMKAEESALNSKRLLLHAATYFGDSNAQFDLGNRYLAGDGFATNSMRGARWLSLAAQKGHVAAQAKLGDLLFNGDADYPRPVEGLMWLKISLDAAQGTENEIWINALYEQAISIATGSERGQALDAAKKYAPRFASR